MYCVIVNFSDEGEFILHVGHFVVAEVPCIVVILSDHLSKLAGQIGQSASGMHWFCRTDIFF